MSRKKIIVLIVIIILLITISLFWLFSRQKQKETSKNNIVTTLTTKTNIEQIKMGQILFPVLSMDKKSILYFSLNEDFVFKQLVIDTKKETKLSLMINAPIKVIYSPDRAKAILKIIYNADYFESSNGPFLSPGTTDKTMTTWIFDFKSQKLTKLNDAIYNVIWSPDSQKILYFFYDGQNSTISMANPDGSGWQKIKDVPAYEGINLGFLSAEEIYYHSLLTEAGGTNLYKLNLKTKKETEIINDESLVEALSSPDNQKFAYALFHPEEQKFTIAFIKTDGSDQKDFGIEESNINKVAWLDNQIIIAAVAQGDDQSDKFYKINTDTGEKTEIPYDGGGAQIDAQNLMPTRDGKTLYFTSDDLLYRIDIGTGNEG